MAAAVLTLVGAVSGCGSGGEPLPTGREIAAVSSPDRVSRMLVWMPERAGFLGATDSDVYQVWIQYSRGTKPQELMFEATKTDGVSVRWLTDRRVEICYGPTNINKFSNIFVYAEQSTPGIYKVEIVLRRVDALTLCRLLLQPRRTRNDMDRVGFLRRLS
jgi:hypothetical protein